MVNWSAFKENLFFDRITRISLDFSRMLIDKKSFEEAKFAIEKAFEEMDGLEKGDVSNPDEKRMVGHYWLREPEICPFPDIRDEIINCREKIKDFAAKIHSGTIKAVNGKIFTDIVLIGIGGSALGPQFVSNALSGSTNKMNIHFLDNTDPQGIERTLRSLPNPASTLFVVVSKSGGTKETRNGQIISKEALKTLGLDYSRNFVAVTSTGSNLYNIAKSEHWLDVFPMWEWVGGRTSELSAVGLLPAALQGFDIDELLSGAKQMDALTRIHDYSNNPAALLALSWYKLGNGHGKKNMVVLPYSDRLELFGRYLQQLVMESLGKKEDRAGNSVFQGLTVFGNKGSTDQHAFVQQLREGPNDFFVVFINVLKDGALFGGSLPENFNASKIPVENGIFAGDYLSGFLFGTRKALYEAERPSITISVAELNEFALGQLIALFERTVGFYASLININAYHQPGVEAGKRAAQEVIGLVEKIKAFIKTAKQGHCYTAAQIAELIECDDRIEDVFHILRKLHANGHLDIEVGQSIFDDRYIV